MSRATNESVGEPALARLTVMDRLEVGPVRLQTDRLTAPYRVHVGGQVTETELRYRWEHDVFDPERESDQQLAAVIGSQVALNYGLFCKELVLHGRFDSADRTCLARMAENTAREIYVKKFLEPNPFLTGAAAKVPVHKRRNYLRAQMVFDDLPEERR